MSAKLYGCSNINDKYNRHIIIIFSVFSRAKKTNKEKHKRNYKKKTRIKTSEHIQHEQSSTE
jgi:hypothetical protein